MGTVPITFTCSLCGNGPCKQPSVCYALNPYPLPVTEQDVRRIVREELHKLLAALDEAHASAPTTTINIPAFLLDKLER